MGLSIGQKIISLMTKQQTSLLQSEKAGKDLATTVYEKYVVTRYWSLTGVLIHFMTALCLDFIFPEKLYSLNKCKALFLFFLKSVFKIAL